MAEKTGAAARREEIRQTHFATLDLWAGEKETGWCAIPRTLSLILGLIDSKQVSGKKSSSSVYLELLTHHRSEGIVEMGREGDHAFAAGYVGTRAIRTWRERMETLEKNHFIVSKPLGNERFGYVALVHPTTAVQKLHEESGLMASGCLPICTARCRQKSRPMKSAWQSSRPRRMSCRSRAERNGRLQPRH